MAAPNRILDNASFRLTAESLASLPKRNNGRYITTFLKEQLAYRKHYISVGYADVDKWNNTEPSLTQPLRTPAPEAAIHDLADFLFGTPVLKARVPLKQKDEKIKSTPTEVTAIDGATITNRGATLPTEQPLSTKRPVKSNEAQTKKEKQNSSKKRPLDEKIHDTEHAGRKFNLYL